MPPGSLDLSGSGALGANVDRMLRRQQKRRDEQYAAMDTRAQLPSFMRGLSSGGFGFDSFGPGHDGRWDAFFQGVDDAAGGKPVRLKGNAGMRLGSTYDPQFQGSAVDGLPAPSGGSGVSLGADAEIARRMRALTLAGLDNAQEQARIAGDAPQLRRQRENILGHGTTETPIDYQRRVGQENAADRLDPRTPVGALRQREADEKLRQSTEAARIAAGSRRDVADINAGASQYGADRRLQGSQEQAQADRETVLARAFQSILTSRYAADEDVSLARRGMAAAQGDDVEPEAVEPEPQSLWQWLRSRSTEPR